MRSAQDFWTGTQFRAARVLLDWTQHDLASVAGVPVRAVGWVENGNVRGENYFGHILDAFEANRIIFIGQKDPDFGEITAVAMFEKQPPHRPQLTLVVDNT